MLAEFAEVESGKRANREELMKAIALCRKQKATLVIAKLDRLARNAAFLLNLRDSGVDFVAVDMPHADKFTVGIMALVAEKERDLISQRTKDGLAAAKRRGIRLGNPNPAEAIRFVGIGCRVETAVVFMPAVTGACCRYAVTPLLRRNCAGIGKITVPVFFAGQIGSPRRVTVGAVVDRAEHRGAGRDLDRPAVDFEQAAEFAPVAGHAHRRLPRSARQSG